MTYTLLLPGLLCDETVWRSILSRLNNETTIVADFTIQADLTQMARDCLELINAPLQVVGFSMGARVAMEMARLAPKRIERMVFLDTGMHPLQDGEIEKRQAIVQYANEHGMQELAKKWLKGMVYPPNTENAELMRSLTEMVLRFDTPTHERQIKALSNRPDASGYLTNITCPVLLVVGKYDQWSPVTQHKEMLALLPNARLEVVENAGHFALVEQADLVTNLVTEFLG